MALLPILEFPDPRLRTKAQPVSAFDADLKRLVADMFETMYAAPGVGLAATQVDVHRQLLVADMSEDADQPLVLINPRILSKDGVQVFQEGCLSFPGIYAEVKRPELCKVRATSPTGEPIEREFDGFVSRIIQHEYDHLEGVLLVDRMSAADKQRHKAALAELVDRYRARIERAAVRAR